MERTRPKIIIADDHTLVAEACKKLLEAEYDVVATVGDGRALVQAAFTFKPQLIVIDVSLPLLNGLDAGQQIKQMLPSVELVYLTMRMDVDMAAEVFRRGASAYLLKDCAALELTVAVREVLKGRAYLSPAIAIDKNRLKKIFSSWPTNKTGLTTGGSSEKVLQLLAEAGEEGIWLTERKRDVLRLLAEGKSMKEIASVLNLTPRTVAIDRDQIMDALHIYSDAELVQYAQQMNVELTPRELEIVPAVVAGYTNKEIAKLLKIREDMVKHHLSNIFDKLGVSTRLELAIYWQTKKPACLEGGDGGSEDEIRRDS